MGPALSIRLAAMGSVFGKIRTKTIKNPTIELKRKLNIIQGLLYAKGLFQAGTWRLLLINEARKVHRRIMIIYRAMLGYAKPGCDHVTDNDIIIKLEILSPLSVVADLRLNLFVRVVRLFALLFIHSFVCSLVRSCTCHCIHSFRHRSSIHSLIHSFMNCIR